MIHYFSIYVSAFSITVFLFCCVTGSPGRSLTVFTNPDVYNTTTLLLSDDEGTLFVGARDAILSIDVSRTDAMAMKEKVSVILI